MRKTLPLVSQTALCLFAKHLHVSQCRSSNADGCVQIPSCDSFSAAVTVASSYKALNGRGLWGGASLGSPTGRVQTGGDRGEVFLCCPVSALELLSQGGPPGIDISWLFFENV